MKHYISVSMTSLALHTLLGNAMFITLNIITMSVW